MDFSEKEYIGMDLREENWEEQELTGVRFVGCRFHGANMMGLVTRNCWFEDCDFSFARLEDSRHTRTAFINCRFYGANLFSAVLEECKGTGSSFSGAVLTGFTLRGGNYAYSVWDQASLKKMELHGCNFHGANLTEVNLEKANLSGCDLGQAVVAGANLTDADLRGAKIDGTDLKSALMKRTKIDLEQAVLLAESLGAVLS